jgi:hypothetical protein
MRSAQRAASSHPGSRGALRDFAMTPPPFERHQRVLGRLAHGPVVLNGTILIGSCRRLAAGERSGFATEVSVS